MPNLCRLQFFLTNTSLLIHNISFIMFTGRDTRKNTGSVLRIAGKSQSHRRREYFPRGVVPRCAIGLSHSNHQPTGRSCWSIAGRNKPHIRTIPTGSDLRGCLGILVGLDVFRVRRLFRRFQPHHLSRRNKTGDWLTALVEPLCVLSIHVLGSSGTHSGPAYGKRGTA